MVTKLSFVVILVLLLFSIFTNFNSSYAQLSPTSSQGYTKLVDASLPTYQLYKNTQYGFSVEYPNTWTVVENLDQKYTAKTIVISPDNNFQFHLGVIKNQNPYASLTSQEILGQITSMLRNGCSGATFQSRGFTCTGPQFSANVTSYRGVPMYEVGMSWTKTLSTGASVKWISLWGFMPSGNDVWLLIVESSVNEFVGNIKASKHMFDSIDISSIPQNNPASSQGTKTIPHWIKNTALWWSQGSVTDDDFIKGIQYLVQQGIITVSATQVSSQASQTIPSWVKNTAKWWSEGQLSDDDFLKGVQYLVQNGIINANPANQQQGNPANQQQGNPANQQQGNPANQQQGGTNAGSSGNTGGYNAVAKDLTGNWAGNAQGTVSFDYYEPGTGDTTEVCTFTGPITLSLNQDGSHLTGNVSPSTFAVSGKPICQQPFQFQGGAIDANVFGSGFSGTVESLNLNAQFTSDLLRGTFSGEAGTLTIQGQFTASRSG